VDRIAIYIKIVIRRVTLNRGSYQTVSAIKKPTSRVNRCATGEVVAPGPTETTVKAIETSGGATIHSPNNTSVVTANNNFCGYIDLQQVTREGDSSLCNDVCLSRESGLHNVVSVCNNVESCSDDVSSHCVNQSSECLELAPLNFVKINVGNSIVTSLVDGGSELNIIRRSEIVNLSSRASAVALQW